MKVSKCDLFDMLAFDKADLKDNNPRLYELRQSLLKEISEHITEDSHVEINFVKGE